MDAEIIDYCVKHDIMVTVYLLTYNHEPYIRQTIDSILKQKINFKMQILVLDDASTDGTSDIVREYAEKYPEIFTAIIQKENKYQKNISIEREIVPYIYGKYVALCEGDDYWLSLNKLQKQFDYMETHPNISGTGGVTCYFTDEGTECMKPAPAKKFRNRILSRRDLIREKGIRISTNTLMLLATMIKDEKYLQAREMSPKVGDGILVPYMFENGGVYIFDDFFQYHRIQTRKDASNYNTLFSMREKFDDTIRVFNARVICEISSHFIVSSYIQQIGLFFVLFVRDCHFFYKTVKNAMPQYRRYTPIAVLYGIIIVFPKLLLQKIWRFMKRSVTREKIR